MLKKVLIANRGEIAVRIIRECLDCSIEAVSVYSTADKQALHTIIATKAICIGGPRAGESYLNISNIIEAAKAENATLSIRASVFSLRTASLPGPVRKTALNLSARLLTPSTGWETSLPPAD